MRTLGLIGLAVALMILPGCQNITDAPASPDGPTLSAASYLPVAISAEDRPGTPRQVRCQVGDDPEQDCTLTPLFGDDSFQLDGEGIALRMVVTGNEAGAFRVFDPERRVGIGGSFSRSSASDPCWVADEGPPGLSPICVR